MSIFSKLLPSRVRFYIREFHAIRDRALRSEAALMHAEAAIDVILGVPTDYQALAFNGQKRRQTIFADLLSALDARLIVETGTYTGITTGYMASTSGLPVISSEVNPRFYQVARLRLKDFSGVRIENVDSRQLLRKLAADRVNTETPTFFYLDAHWYGDFPLREEIELIAENWPEFMILIDDFRVTGDDGYGFDDYGGGESLTVDYIRGVVSKYDLAVFFPAARSSEETGHRRGCVTLAPKVLACKLEGLKSVRRGSA
ncbi:MAG TPA: hypothetical protein VJ810_00285 [Blastocatellia bacterium]|nr:hypothetical protein [Blastocatellia bacterium]